eukprot:5149348-Alexandrium_andersonii.AAC.1
MESRGAPRRAVETSGCSGELQRAPETSRASPARVHDARQSGGPRGTASKGQQCSLSAALSSLFTQL